MLAPLRVAEAADSLAKASTPEPFSTSKTSNWVARGGGLPAYIQHIAHDLVEKRGKSESNAIQMAIGIVKNPPANWGADARAAAAKAAAEWEALKARSGAKSAVQHAGPCSFADEYALRESALGRLVVLETQFGLDGMVGLLAEGVLQESAASSWAPTMKRTASASSEVDRHEVHDGSGQHVGTISRRKSYDRNAPDRYAAHAINGERISSPDGSKADALEALRKHLEEAPARVGKHKSGKFLVARPASYSGPDTYTAYPSESSARYAAGLPEKASVPEKGAQVAKLGEMLRFDLLTVSGMDIPPLRRVQEARRADPFDLVSEAFSASELRDFHGRWRGGGHVLTRSGSMELSPRSVAPTNTRPASRLRQASVTRYEGGASAHPTPATRSRMMSMFRKGEKVGKQPQGRSDVHELYAVAEQHRKAFGDTLKRVHAQLGGHHHDLDQQSSGKASPETQLANALESDRNVPHVIVGPMKKLADAVRKVGTKYNGNASKLNDVVRGTIAVPRVDDVPKALDALRSSLPKGWQIHAPENRFVSGRRDDKVHVGPLVTGYRDVAVVLRSPQGFNMEVQISTTHFVHAKGSGGHALYDRQRKILAAAKGRQLSRSEAHQVKMLTAQMQKLYGVATIRSNRRATPR